MAKKNEEKTEKMTLQGYYESLSEATHPKTEFLNTVASRCNVSSTTARNWVTGRTKPMNPRHIQVLTEVTGIEESELWKA